MVHPHYGAGGRPEVVEDVDTVVDELVGEESVGHEELADGDEDVEELAEEEDVGVLVELVVHKLEVIVQKFLLLFRGFLHIMAWEGML